VLPDWRGQDGDDGVAITPNGVASITEFRALEGFLVRQTVRTPPACLRMTPQFKHAGGVRTDSCNNGDAITTALEIMRSHLEERSCPTRLNIA